MVYAGGFTSEIDDPYRYGRVLTDFDLHLLGEGKHTRISRSSARTHQVGAVDGTHFAVWAPNAERVSVVGDFNGWDGRVHPMRSLGAERHLGDFRARRRRTASNTSSRFGRTCAATLLQKSDPFGFAFEMPPQTASIVTRHDYTWRDASG